jgi:hypothetical protein
MFLVAYKNSALKKVEKKSAFFYTPILFIGAFFRSFSLVSLECWMEIQPSVELWSLCASCYIWRQCASICEENPRVSGSYDPTKCQKNKIF